MKTESTSEEDKKIAASKEDKDIPYNWSQMVWSATSL